MIDSISRRSLLALAASPLMGQGIPNVPYRNYARCLPDHLRTLAADAYDRRVKAIAALDSEVSIRERQQWVRKTFWELVGGEPKKTPLNARVTNTVQRTGFRIECLVYESQPGFHVSANLYIPTTGKPPYPGVIFQPGHSTNGKSYELYQLCCQGLALLGFVVLTFDPMGQGERTFYRSDIPWESRLPGGADDEHTLPGKQMLLVGDTATRLQTWDAVRSLDYLAAHPLVDPTRLASTGQSGGGTNTMLLAAVDDRLATAVACCANTENVAAKDFIPPGATDDAEQNFVGSGAVGFDRWDLLYPLAPKPLLVLASAKDFFGTYSPNYMRSGVEEFERLHGIYQKMGHADRIAWHDSPLPHGVSYDMRLHTYNWMRRWLQGNETPITEEPTVSALPDRELFATKVGNVVVALKGETPASLARKIPQARSDARTALNQLLKPKRPVPGRATTIGRTAFRNVSIEAIEVQSAKDVFLPAWLYRPKSEAATKGTLLILDSSGRQGWREGGFLDQLAASGIAVCAADVRGIGDLMPEFSGGAVAHARSHATEQHYAWSSMILGETLAAQRVTDVLALVEALKVRANTSSVAVAARGILTTPALFAAAVDPTIRGLLLSGGLISFRDVLDAEEFIGGGYFTPPNQMNQDIFGSFVPGILKHTDLPEIATSLAPRKILIAPRGANGAAIPEAKAKSIFNNASNVEILQSPEWGAAIFRRLLG